MTVRKREIVDRLSDGGVENPGRDGTSVEIGIHDPAHSGTEVGHRSFGVGDTYRLAPTTTMSGVLGNSACPFDHA